MTFYSSPPEYSLPRRPSGDEPADEAYVRSLEARVAALEGHMSALLNDSTLRRHRTRSMGTLVGGVLYPPGAAIPASAFEPK